ncbi:putative phage replisome organizer [Paenibacillus jamilae]|uniref:Replication protein n=1 Tax=Paenibacillus ottowii TaxID=2315729 RepID=A0ABY3B565_9BACL|nr:phage replisome organizer N-terminal domain-containing protein [Paenibacillus ottowii]MDP9676253.1 putative phage replisome organizer [Paenibacillus jamilae]TQR97339.1 replication protein [Paenibacillus ottowii]
MANVTWFKVLTDIFSDDKIKIIQSMPEGDSLLVMWFKILSQAGKTNDGGYIYLKRNMPYTAGMLSTLFNKPQQMVELALRTFSEFEMIDIDEKGYIFVTNWEKHQAIEKMDKIREQTRLRVQKHRENKRIELQGSTKGVTCNVTVTDGNETEVDIEVDKDITTTTDENDYSKIDKAYRQIHHNHGLTAKEWPVVSGLLKDGIPVDTIISVMKEKYQKKTLEGGEVNSFSFYTQAIKERHQGIGMRKKHGRMSIFDELERELG